MMIDDSDDVHVLARDQVYDWYASTCREDQWPSIKASFDGLSDRELLEFVLYDLGKPRSYKELFEALEKRKRENCATSKNVALRNKRVDIVTPETREAINREICKSHPSDCIKLTRETDVKLVDLWLGKERKDHAIPSDLFFAKTIPLMDCEIEVDERNAFENGQICKYRVCIFDSYKGAVESGIDMPIIAGALICYFESCREIFSFVIIPGYDNILQGSIYLTGTTKEAEAHYIESVSEQSLGMAFIEYMQTWYGIQIALLNPMTKDIFANPQREPVTRSNNGKPRKKKPVRYVKVHRIPDDELDNRMYVTEGKRKIRRKTMLWYVIGHWRHYKNGKVIFIQPYWKGPLRDTKKPLEAREREIVTGNTPCEGQQSNIGR